MLRPTVWMLLLDFLPDDRQEWASLLLRKRELYRDWLEEFCGSTNTMGSESSGDPLGALADPSQSWEAYYKQNTTLRQIYLVCEYRNNVRDFYHQFIELTCVCIVFNPVLIIIRVMMRMMITHTKLRLRLHLRCR